MATPPPSPPQLPAGAALPSPSRDAGAGGDAPAVSSMASVSVQVTGVNLESNELKPELADGFLDEWNAENVEKLKKYEAAYSRRLKAKYFSMKTLNGEDIFDHETIVDNVIIKSSRWPCTRSFADPIQNMEDQKGFPSSTEAETPFVATIQESII
ncbi:uncharacterized protein LOC110109279 [Dendrobium catenatum]|uniref:uncharacterized protein LOC110109279 n=1 Tax=Dendrobium catenatum TaxID=906689 RepID=UPI0010A00F08|nr:uncharacterized protein LOC110109279 [Dendrobium catenatum]